MTIKQRPINKYTAQEKAYLNSSIVIINIMEFSCDFEWRNQELEQTTTKNTLLHPTSLFFIVLLFSENHEYLIIRNFIILNGLNLIMKYECGFTPVEHN